MLYFDKKHTFLNLVMAIFNILTCYLFCFIIFAKQINFYKLVKIDTFASINVFVNGIKAIRKNS